MVSSAAQTDENQHLVGGAQCRRVPANLGDVADDEHQVLPIADQIFQLQEMEREARLQLIRARNRVYDHYDEVGERNGEAQ